MVVEQVLYDIVATGCAPPLLLFLALFVFIVSFFGLRPLLKYYPKRMVYGVLSGGIIPLFISTAVIVSIFYECKVHLAHLESGIPTVIGSITDFKEPFQTMQKWKIGDIDFYVSEQSSNCFNGFDRNYADFNAVYKMSYIPRDNEKTCILLIQKLRQ